MAELKGFYFSLDAILATSVLMGVIMLLTGYTSGEPAEKRIPDLDQIHNSAVQKVSNWNSSIDSSKTVLGHIYYQYYSGNISRAEQTCLSYFRIEKPYALYMINSTHRQKICGSIQKDAELATESVITPDIPVNQNFQGPKKAVLVVED
ncbi:MAG: hypothetical protein ABEJ95_00785 [Candidatus Nanohalobium sp.]